MINRLSQVAKGASLCTVIALSAAACAAVPVPKRRNCGSQIFGTTGRAKRSTGTCAGGNITGPSGIGKRRKRAVTHASPLPQSSGPKSQCRCTVTAEATAQQRRAHKEAADFDASMSALRQGKRSAARNLPSEDVSHER